MKKKLNEKNKKQKKKMCEVMCNSEMFVMFYC